ncbi:MAG: carboxymuconolactone decarboxylase family protein [Dehalococcoidia bacterium]
MTKVPEITRREDLPTDQQPIFDEITAGYGGNLVGPFRVLLHSPELARRVSHTGAYIRREATLPADVRELAVIATARELDCQYEWAVHEGGARRAGVGEDVIMAVRDRKAPEGLSSEEAVVVTYAQELLRNHRVSGPTFKAALERFGIEALVELTATIGHYSMLACALNAFEVMPETLLLPE